MSQLCICDVCRLLDNDMTPKLGAYCNLCDAFICEADQSNWARRLLAAAKRRLEPDYFGQPDYVEKIQEQIAKARQ
jgi:hypothetical protein